MQIVILNYQDRNFMGSLSYNHSYQSKVGLLEIQEFLNKTSFMGFTPGKRLMSPLSKSGKGGSWSARERPHAGRVNSRASLRLGRSLVNYNETYRSNVQHKPQTLPLYLMI